MFFDKNERKNFKKQLESKLNYDVILANCRIEGIEYPSILFKCNRQTNWGVVYVDEKSNEYLNKKLYYWGRLCKYEEESKELLIDTVIISEFLSIEKAKEILTNGELYPKEYRNDIDNKSSILTTSNNE
ncbi:hypothetical protein KW95_04390 [Clostridioides difficile]|nr:hypothetical protein KW95_04390 [Clostridioides difficile]